MLTAQTEVCASNEAGNSLLKTVTSTIESADETIVLCSFLLGSRTIVGALRDAASRGVRIYVMTARDGLKLNHPERDQPKADHLRRVLIELAEFSQVRVADHWHAKFVLVDPFCPIPSGWMISANLNEASLISSPEFAVPLTHEQTREISEILRNEFFRSQHQVRRDGSFFPSPVGPVLPDSSSLQLTTTTLEDPGAIDNRLMESIYLARNSVILSTFSVLPKSPVLRALENAARRGVAVTLLAHIDSRHETTLAELVGAGGRVLGIEWLHAKMAAVDELPVLFSSRNLDNPSAEVSLDFLIELDDIASRDSRTWLDFQIASAPWQLAE